MENESNVKERTYELDAHIWEKQMEELNGAIIDIVDTEEDGNFLTRDDVLVVTAIIEGAKTTLEAFHDSLVERARVYGPVDGE